MLRLYFGKVDIFCFPVLQPEQDRPPLPGERAFAQGMDRKFRSVCCFCAQRIKPGALGSLNFRGQILGDVIDDGLLGDAGDLVFGVGIVLLTKHEETAALEIFLENELFAIGESRGFTSEQNELRRDAEYAIQGRNKQANVGFQPASFELSLVLRDNFSIVPRSYARHRQSLPSR
jgi:hypothetical protein